MKLQELGLKSKPQTKYFEGGYVSFSTMDDELSYEIVVVNKTGHYPVWKGKVSDKQELDYLLEAKGIEDVSVWL